MKGFLRNIVVTICSILILGSTLSFTVHKHYCLSALKDISINTPADGCGMEKMFATATEDCEVAKSPCCNDIQELVEGNDILKLDQFHQVDLDLNLSLNTLPVSEFTTVFLHRRDFPVKPLEPPPLSHPPLFIVFQHFIV